MVDLIIINFQIPELTTNMIIETLITLPLVFYAVCLTRSYCLAIRTESYVDPQEVDRVAQSKSGSVLTIGEEEDKSEFEIEMCKKCEKFRFKRSHHCSVCRKCVDKLDHHCFILNNCVGRKNYHYFISYLFLVTELSLFILILSSLVIYQFKRDISNVSGIIALPLLLLNFPLRAVLTWLISCVSFIMVGYFFTHHMKLVLYDKTSLEHKYKISHDKNKETQIRNSSLKEKAKLMYRNLIHLIKGESVFDLFWPD